MLLASFVIGCHICCEGVTSSSSKGGQHGEAAAEDDEEDSSGLDDLLVCLGQVHTHQFSMLPFPHPDTWLQADTVL